ncbi:MAG: hypothetical protein MI864_27665 [Pseudomonadales bacterium]|nr:hypothetical protein [Pseudomonadales bacterium]
MTKISNSFVAMFDFLGFKQLRKKEGTLGLHDTYRRSLKPLIEHSAAMKRETIERGGKPVTVPVFDENSINYRIVSDSIILFTKDDSFDEFFKIITASHNLLCSGFGTSHPLRGAIGYGDFINDNDSIWLGSAIEDAYIGESSQMWSGCSLTKDCEKFVSERGYIDQYLNHCNFLISSSEKHPEHVRKNLVKASKRIVRYPIPEQHQDKDAPTEYMYRPGYALDWTLNVFDGASEKSFLPTTSTHAGRIRENTIEFERWARSKDNLKPGEKETMDLLVKYTDKETLPVELEKLNKEDSATEILQGLGRDFKNLREKYNKLGLSTENIDELIIKMISGNAIGRGESIDTYLENLVLKAIGDR